MAGDASGNIVGFGFVTAGILIAYGAFTNRRLFGPNGVITRAITTGTIPDVNASPIAYLTDFAISKSKGDLESAITSIRSVNGSLADNLNRDVQQLISQHGSGDGTWTVADRNLYKKIQDELAIARASNQGAAATQVQSYLSSNLSTVPDHVHHTPDGGA